MNQSTAVTHIGGPTVLVEVDGWRLLTDPTFDLAGQRYHFGWGTSSRKLTGPAITVTGLPTIDAVLLSHDQHEDNLDRAGRAMLPAAAVVVTTPAAARRLVHRDVRGLAAGESTVLAAPGRPDLRVTATPARHGPALLRPVVGAVAGFAVRRDDEERVRVWVTGDTVPHRALDEAARGMAVDVAVVHVGAAGFPVTGPVRFTMDAREAVDLVALALPRVAVPVHYEGWSHFRSERAELDDAIAAAPAEVRARFRVVALGERTELRG